MPEIEFQLKRKELIKKDEEEISVDRIINPEKYEKGTMEEYRIFYSPITIELAEMHPILEDDAEHTALFDRNTGEIYVVRAKYRNIKYVKEFLSGGIIRNIEHFAIDETLLNKVDKMNEVLNTP